MLSLSRRTIGMVVTLLACLALAPLAIRAELDGGYTLETVRAWRRDIADWRLAAAMQHVPCPKTALVIAALGQSNAGNHVGTRVAADPKLPAFAFFRDRCAPIADPLPGATGNDGSLWTALAQRLAREHGQPVVIIAGAAAGSSVRDWDLDNVGIRSRALRSLAGARRAGLPPHVIVWIQGEADGETRLPQQTYARHLEAVVGRINAELAEAPAASPAWIITQTSRCRGEHTRSEDVRAAQRAVAAKIPNGHLGPDTDALDETFRTDGCHFNDRGRSAIANALVDQLATIAR
jgi:hypothetical protein